MDKSAIKTFAIESRRQLIESVKYQASLIGITENSISEPISKAEGMETYDYGVSTYAIFDDDIRKRKNLVHEIENKGFENVVEEVAYTWFNRIIAIRFMEVNDFLPSRTRVLSSEIEGKTEPDIITEALDIDLNLTADDKDLIFKLKDKNELDELFQFLFIKQCNKLSEILPGLFEKTDDYSELLLKISFINENEIIFNLLNNIPEHDFSQVEIIGWLYQYYNSELKDEYNNAIVSKPIQKNQIPAVTQLFTPDWIVKYLTDNSLGRYWIERNKNSNLKESLSFYVEEPQQNSEVQKICNELRNNNVSINELKFFDPCMGSAHILVYAFEVFRKIYIELGYIENEIPQLILTNNLFGLDIDKRAYQLAYFALMMKGRQYDRRLLSKNIVPNVYHIIDSNLNTNLLNTLKNFDDEFGSIIEYLGNVFINGQEYGSLIKIKNLDFEFIESKYVELINNYKINKLSDLNLIEELNNNVLPLIKQAKILSSKYEIVVTNPPYMNKYDSSLKEFCKKYYKDFSKDLFSIFIYRNFDFCKLGGYIAFMTPLVWMYLKSFEMLRKYIINNKYFVSLIEMEYLTLWEIEAHVPACNFILGNYNFNSQYHGTFFKLSDFTGGLNVQKEKTLEAIHNDVDYKFVKSSDTFLKIPGNPIAYWVSDSFTKTFDNGICIDDISGHTGSQNKTANNNKYIRYFWEVSSDDIGVNNKWIFYAKGGDYRKYYGNLDLVVDWSDEARDFYNNKTSNLLDEKYWFKEGITYTKISSKAPSFRYLPENCIFDMGGPSICYLKDNLNYILGLFNSNLIQYYLDIFNPTLNIQSKDIRALPIIIDEEYKPLIDDLVSENIEIFKNDYYSHENTFLFKKHPLLNYPYNLIESCYNDLKKEKESIFDKQITNEVKLNKIFLQIYGVEDVDAEVNKDDIKLDLYDLKEIVKSFISYAVGCMFGRYSFGSEGLQFAGGNFDLNNYSRFIPDDDNIIPVLDAEYFDDDIVGRFIDFVKICFGKETLEENLDFIARTLNKKGKTSREIIRNYFLTDFFKDHAKMYKKCPIYWQFNSGRQNAFNCLIYMHRYEPDIIARVRTDYLHKTQKAIEQNLAHCDNIISNSTNKSEVSRATKDKSKYIKQLEEIKVYDEALRHMATQNIKMDLDDGVKVNYAKFQKVEISIEGEKPKKINLLKNI